MNKLKASYFTILCLLLLNIPLFSQNVGIGTTTPLARLHVADSNVLFTGPPSFTNYNPPQLPPLQGAGTRMMWYPQKGAFRAGWVEDNRWNKDSIGIFSMAFGHSTLASNTGSTAFGVRTSAKGVGSTALGWNSNANTDFSFAAGFFSTASGINAFALGTENIASGYWSTSIGLHTIASGHSSFATGDSAIASGTQSVAAGGYVMAKARGSFSTGWYNDINDNPDPTFTAPNDRIFQIGNGSGFLATRSNALTVLRNANTGIGITTPRFPLSFNNSNGDKISLYDDGNPSMLHFGLGVFSNQLMQLYSATSLDDIAFGYGNSGSFTERMRIKGNGKVGIGTTTPIARLHVADSNVLFTGPVSTTVTTTYSPPASGAGTRMMWYPQKAAFRVGSISGTQWDKDSVGRFSFATGTDSKAIGEASTSMGFTTTANGFAATSMGRFTMASGLASTSMGDQTNATGDYSTTMGYITTASGHYSTTMGSYTTASGMNSTSMGFVTTASGHYSSSNGYGTIASGFASTSMGSQTIARGINSTSMGNATIAKSPQSLTIGLFNDSTNTNRLFEIGNGTSNTDRKNALTVLTNGSVGIGTINPTRPLSFPAVLGEKILLYPGGAGEVGIGVYGNELRLHADNPGASVSFGTQDNAGVFTQAGRFQISAPYALFVNGSIWANGNTYASDERFKQNITRIQSPLQKLLQINGVEYEMKTGSFQKNNFQKGRQIGLLAQNVEKIIPEAVNEIDGYKGVDYARLIPLLIESIKEQQMQIEELKKLIQQEKK